MQPDSDSPVVDNTWLYIGIALAAGFFIMRRR